MRREITTWDELTVFFTHTFGFTDKNIDVHNELQLLRNVVLKVLLVAYPVDLHAHCQIQSMMECYNVLGGPDDDDDLWNINIPKVEGIWDVTAPDVLTDPMNNPLKIRKVNIRMEEKPKFANVRDYWDEDTMAKITYLLHKFQDLFLTKFSMMKGILGDLG